MGLGLLVSSVLETADAEYAMLATEGSLWLFATLLGISTAMLQARIDHEIVQRESAARRSEQEVQKIRLDLATDAHDTVSHALATEAAILRVIGNERGEGLDERVLSELALVNARAQRQLRQLLTRLNSPAGTGFGVDLAREIDATLTAIRGGARAGGFDIDVSTGRLPGRVDIRFAETVQFVLFELATNILKHASAPDLAAIHVGLAPGGSGDELILSSRNLAAGESEFVPLTLDRRSRGSGGTCSVSWDADGCVTVEVVLLLAEGDSTADFICTDEALGSAAVVDSLHAHDGDSVHGFSPAVRRAFRWWRAPRPAVQERVVRSLRYLSGRGRLRRIGCTASNGRSQIARSTRSTAHD